jgi:hypothetical protein
MWYLNAALCEEVGSEVFSFRGNANRTANMTNDTPNDISSISKRGIQTKDDCQGK